MIWAHKGFALDMSQLTLQGVTPGSIATGLVLVMFGFSGTGQSITDNEEPTCRCLLAVPWKIWG